MSNCCPNRDILQVKGVLWIIMKDKRHALRQPRQRYVRSSYAQESDSDENSLSLSEVTDHFPQTNQT